MNFAFGVSPDLTKLVICGKRRIISSNFGTSTEFEFLSFSRVENTGILAEKIFVIDGKKKNQAVMSLTWSWYIMKQLGGRWK